MQGGIGKLLARKASRGLEMKIVYHNRNQLSKEEEIYSGDAQYYKNMDDLLKMSDFVSVHVPLTSSTKHLLSHQHFKLMKKSAFVINTSRGPVIDEEALVDALTTGKITGAGLDVFEAEPKVHPSLFKLPNVTLLPHIGTCTQETRSEMWELCIQNCVSVLKTGKPKTPVNSPI
jgi:glyoxylate reductase